MGPVSALLVVAVLAITPAVMFVLFWRFLLSLRDDALIADLRLYHDLELTPVTVPVLERIRGDSSSATLTTCPHCTVETITENDSCVSCSRRLE